MRRYISDLHFYHEGLIAFMDKRGFADVEAMNTHMIHQWNSIVGPRDDVVVLGDLSFGNGEQTNEILRRLHGNIFLIEGNHDHRFLKDKDFDMSLLGWVKPYAELKDNHRKVILSHYPVFCYNGQYRKNEQGQPMSYMLYGHVHDTHDEALIHQFQELTRSTRVMSKGLLEPAPIPCQMINCFCMYSDYKPLTLDRWIEVDRIRREARNQAEEGQDSNND